MRLLPKFNMSIAHERDEVPLHHRREGPVPYQYGSRPVVAIDVEAGDVIRVPRGRCTASILRRPPPSRHPSVPGTSGGTPNYTSSGWTGITNPFAGDPVNIPSQRRRVVASVSQIDDLRSASFFSTSTADKRQWNSFMKRLSPMRAARWNRSPRTLSRSRIHSLIQDLARATRGGLSATDLNRLDGLTMRKSAPAFERRLRSVVHRAGQQVHDH